MTCPACHYTNDDEAQFCEQCGHALEISCPACGGRTRASARFCRRCGQALIPSLTASQSTAALESLQANTPSLDERLDQLQRYLPAHLAAKILANRGRLAGERKLVTVLFADLVGYSTLSVQLGEEALFALMDNLYELLIHEIHRYEGTVNELTGDGLVAFFGAPLAVEQSPQRAIRAALAMQEAVARFNARLQHSADLHVRVGINTGPVIVGTVGNNLRMDYKAVGHTVNLAARMEQTAVSGTVQLTEHTYKLVAGYFDCDDVGAVSLKGIPTRVRAYRVTGERGLRTRLEVARERGLTRLVGRQRELDMLRQCFALVQGGRGQAVSIIGEAGLGKSRLLYEFRQTLGDVDYTWLEGRCSPYGAALAYGPIIEVLKHYCGIDASDRDEDMRQKVAHGLAQLGPAQEATVPYLIHLLAAGMDESRLASLAPEALKHQIFEALRGLVGAIAARRLLVLAIEDLHWIDPTTTEVLTFLLEHLAGARILLLCTYRPDFASLWSRKSYHSVLTLKPLDSHEGFEMLTALLGTPHMQDELAALVLNKTEGVPFFLEELVTALRETGAVALHEDQWRLTASATAVPVPDTVEEVLMSRLDRLPEGAKSVLQTGAIIGREVSGALLQEVVGLPEHELTTHLAALTEAELLYTRGLQPQTIYVFKHAFTQDATYRSVLTARRRELHHRVAVTIEALFPDRLEEYYGQLAYHYLEGAQGDAVAKAIAYAVRAGERYMALPAYAEATRFYRLALEALEQHAPADEAQRYALLLALGVAQRKASEYVDALETLQRAAESARRLGSAEALAQAAIEFEGVTWLSLLAVEPAVHLLQEALQELGEEYRTLRARALGSLARALLFTGAEEQATQYAQQAVAVAREVGDPGALAFALQTLILVLWEPAEARERLLIATEMVQLAETAGNSELLLEAHTHRMQGLLELGDIQEVDAELEVRVRLAEELQQSSYLATTTGMRAMRALLDGRFTEAERLALQARDIEQRVQLERAAGAFGMQMFTLRREQGRLREVEPVLRHFVQQHGTASTWRPGLALLYSELGRERDARTIFERLAQHDFANLPHDALWMGCMTYLAEVCAFLGDAARAAVLYQLLLPYAGHTVVVGGGVVCYGAASRYLGVLATTMKHWEDAAQHFEDAWAMNARMGAWPWLAHTQHQYAVMLLARNQPDDRDRAIALLDEALTTARALGMRALETRLTGQGEQRTAPVSAILTSLDDLSQREVEVLRLLAVGKSNREIADVLCISLNTVATHVRNILIKTGTANRTEAATYALRYGLRTE